MTSSIRLFQVGDRVQLTGPKERVNTITLEQDGAFHSHHGSLFHSDLIGKPEGSVVANNAGELYLALRPLLSDYVMSMPRGAAIVYPKDAAQILSMADIFPGATVVEAGVGSGALTLHLLRAVGTQGRVFSFERRQEFADIATTNISAYCGDQPENWKLYLGNLQEELTLRCPPNTVDRVVLDMLAPWECISEVASALTPGGVLLCYVATVTQLSRVVETIRDSGRFTHPKPVETMVRGWHVEGLAVRPNHRMVGHTGFLVTARKLADGNQLPHLKRPASKTDYSEADVEAWTPEALGEKEKSSKVLRKRLRDAERLAPSKNVDDAEH